MSTSPYRDEIFYSLDWDDAPQHRFQYMKIWSASVKAGVASSFLGTYLLPQVLGKKGVCPIRRFALVLSAYKISCRGISAGTQPSKFLIKAPLGSPRSLASAMIQIVVDQISVIETRCLSHSFIGLRS